MQHEPNPSDEVQPAAADSSVAEKLPFEQEHLAALERMRALRAYYEWTYTLLGPYVGQRVLDAGCGIGNFTELAAETAEHVVAVDLSPENVEVLKQRFIESDHVEILQADLDSDLPDLKARRLDTIVCLDVLEHVEQDVALLKRFAALVEPGAHLLIKVPACPWLYGSVDVASAHFRRYSLKELNEKAEAAGWEPVKTSYMNIWGVLPYWLKSCVLKRQANFSRTFKPWQLGLIRTLIPLLRRADRLVGPPVGQSAILIARRK